jgi:FkbM family methyltransferase
MCKAFRYWNEIQLDWKLGADWSSRLRLTFSSLLFHLRVGLKLKPSPNEAARAYRLALFDSPCQVWLRTTSGDFFVLPEVFLDESYYIPPALLRRCTTIIDAGANVGLTTLYFARVYPSAHFVCVEPVRGNLELLRLNTRSLGARVRVVEGALSGTPGTLVFADSAWSWGGKVSDSAMGYSVRAYTMVELLEMANLDHIDLLKLDIEGAERSLLSSSPAWLDKVSTIVIETHDGYLPGDFARDVGAHGFSVVMPNTQGNKMLMAARADV